MPLTIGIKGLNSEVKTSAAEALIAALTARGHNVGAIKSHTHGGFDFDRPGKASYRHRTAGAVETVMSSPEVLADVRYRAATPSLVEALSRFSPAVDVIVCDGFADQADMTETAPFTNLGEIVDRAEHALTR